MRLGVTVGEKISGGWDMIFSPEEEVGIQKIKCKQLKVAEGEGKYKRAILLLTSGERKTYKFKVDKVEAKKSKKKSS